jgi:hypothetical protein
MPFAVASWISFRTSTVFLLFGFDDHRDVDFAVFGKTY